MDNKVYETLVRQLQGPRIDLAINYENLGLLNSEQRIIIESMLFRLCETGYTEAFKCIPYLQTISEEKIQTLLNLNLDDRKKGSLFNGLFLRRKDPSYLDGIINQSIKDPMNFNDLIDTYNSPILDEESKENLKQVIDRIYNDKYDDIDYRMLYEYKMPQEEEKRL